NLTHRREQVLDARSHGRFVGTEPEPRPGLRPGHIPGSLNLPYELLHAKDGTLLGLDALRRAFETAGVDLDRPVVTTCGSGITARVAPLLAKLVKDPHVVPVEFRRRPPGQKRGRYMLHRAPRFNVTSVVWGPGEAAAAHNHETWGVIGVIDNEIEETRYRVE